MASRDDKHQSHAPTQREIERAAGLLRAGELVAFPTETVYGLGADATNERALERLYAAKGRPASHPVIVHLASGDELDRWARDVPPSAVALADAFWPGPLTLILRRAAGVSDRVTGGQQTVGLRVPAHPVAQSLLAAVGRGVAAPSANRFGQVSPTSAQAVREALGDAVATVLDAGRCEVGVESTIVDLSGDRARLVRPGGVPAEDLERPLGAVLAGADAAMRAPGALASHYAPRASLRICPREELAAAAAREILAGRRVAAICPAPAPELDERVLLLGSPADDAAYAHELYALLNAADAAGADVILAVEPGPGGLGRAVADRLRRAADA